jgi:hypothetical protein
MKIGSEDKNTKTKQGKQPSLFESSNNRGPVPSGRSSNQKGITSASTPMLLKEQYSYSLNHNIPKFPNPSLNSISINWPL